MSLQDRVDELEAQQGSPEEDHLLQLRIVRYERHGTAHPGVNETYYVVFDDGREGFHKPFAGVAVPTAQHYGHHPDEVPIHECAAWRWRTGSGRHTPRSSLPACCGRMRARRERSARASSGCR